MSNMKDINEKDLENPSNEQVISYLNYLYSRCLEDLQKLEQDLEKDIQLDSEEINSMELPEKKHKHIDEDKKKLLKNIANSKKKLNKAYTMIRKL